MMDTSLVIPYREATNAVVGVTIFIFFLPRSVRGLLNEVYFVPSSSFDDNVFFETNVKLNKVSVFSVSPGVYSARVFCRWLRGAFNVIFVDIVGVPVGILC